MMLQLQIEQQSRVAQPDLDGASNEIPPHLNCVTTLPCETRILLVVTDVALSMMLQLQIEQQSRVAQPDLDGAGNESEDEIDAALTDLQATLEGSSVSATGDITRTPELHGYIRFFKYEILTQSVHAVLLCANVVMTDRLKIYAKAGIFLAIWIGFMQSELHHCAC